MARTRGKAKGGKMSERQDSDVVFSDERRALQLAAISTAAIGYWKEGDHIHPDYDTVALRDVAKLYAKYAALYMAAQEGAT